MKLPRIDDTTPNPNVKRVDNILSPPFAKFVKKILKGNSSVDMIAQKKFSCLEKNYSL